MRSRLSGVVVVLAWSVSACSDSSGPIDFPVIAGTWMYYANAGPGSVAHPGVACAFRSLPFTITQTPPVRPAVNPALSATLDSMYVSCVLPERTLDTVYPSLTLTGDVALTASTLRIHLPAGSVPVDTLVSRAELGIDEIMRMGGSLLACSAPGCLAGVWRVERIGLPPE